MQGPHGADSGTTGGSHPTVLFLVVLVVMEIGAYAALRWAFRSVHGG